MASWVTPEYSSRRSTACRNSNSRRPVPFLASCRVVAQLDQRKLGRHENPVEEDEQGGEPEADHRVQTFSTPALPSKPAGRRKSTRMRHHEDEHVLTARVVAQLHQLTDDADQPST